MYSDHEFKLKEADALTKWLRRKLESSRGPRSCVNTTYGSRHRMSEDKLPPALLFKRSAWIVRWQTPSEDPDPGTVVADTRAGTSIIVSVLAKSIFSYRRQLETSGSAVTLRDATSSSCPSEALCLAN